MRRYGIARYLRADEKARALSADYAPAAVENLLTGEVHGSWRADGACPLGLALGYCWSPGAGDVASALWGNDRGGYWAIERAAATFICAWDDGRIPPDQCFTDWHDGQRDCTVPNYGLDD